MTFEDYNGFMASAYNNHGCYVQLNDFSLLFYCWDTRRLANGKPSIRRSR